jgi:hypothetical protein
MLYRVSSCVRLGGLLIAAATLVAACERPAESPAGPSSDSINAAVMTGSGPALAAKGGRKEGTITLFDACDPESFNAALGPGTCVRNGGIKFDQFLELLGKHHSVGPWHFAPGQLNLAIGGTLIANNRGGETHTFTEVDDFGGGIVPLLNQLAGTPNVAPECAQLQAGDFLAPGTSSQEVEDEEGVEKYQCCIHPWMRAEVRIGGH